mmetsp:Transcript_17214/g.25040  ORF Transcript_17214/g.25040 Transcript_17214/m.25040 type:complete len:128 (-) Transcript_17214:142-525(-)
MLNLLVHSREYRIHRELHHLRIQCNEVGLADTQPSRSQWNVVERPSRDRKIIHDTIDANEMNDIGADADIMILPTLSFDLSTEYMSYRSTLSSSSSLREKDGEEERSSRGELLTSTSSKDSPTRTRG